MVELGCWPGGWLQVLAEQLGPQARIVGVDVEELSPLPGVVFLRLDFTDPDAPDQVAEALEGPAAAVLCDAAPKLSGIRDVDRAAQEELHEAALAIAERVLDPDKGFLILKGFPGPEADRVRRFLRRRFPQLSEAHLEASRSTSKEFYWVAGPAPRGRGRKRDRRRSRRR